MTEHKPFKIKLHPLMDEKELNAISDATLAAIDDQLCKLPRLTEDDIGKEIKNEGIYLGTYEPVDRDGNSLSQTFNVFAAPKDLPGGTLPYFDAARRIGCLRNWYGYDGTKYSTDKELYAALKDGSYRGGWIIPTCDILFGKNMDGRLTTPDNILAHKDKGLFRGTFKVAASSGSIYPGWYWSSTNHRDKSDCTLGVRFFDGHKHWYHGGGDRLSCRPVRLVPV